MSIKSIDMQILMPKVHEVAKINSEEQQRYQGMIAQQAESTQKEAKSNTNTVYKQKRNQEASIREREGGRHKNENKKEKNKKKKTKHSSENLKDTNYHIDIRL